MNMDQQVPRPWPYIIQYCVFENRVRGGCPDPTVTAFLPELRQLMEDVVDGLPGRDIQILCEGGSDPRAETYLAQVIEGRGCFPFDVFCRIYRFARPDERELGNVLAAVYAKIKPTDHSHVLAIAA
jgi:hypothetical protein